MYLGRGGVTTIITTHYVEEARQANRVGILRHGKLVVQDKPADIIIGCEVDTLEEAFLSLCSKTGQLRLSSKFLSYCPLEPLLNQVKTQE